MRKLSTWTRSATTTEEDIALRGRRAKAATVVTMKRLIVVGTKARIAKTKSTTETEIWTEMKTKTQFDNTTKAKEIYELSTPAVLAHSNVCGPSEPQMVPMKER